MVENKDALGRGISPATTEPPYEPMSNTQVVENCADKLKGPGLVYIELQDRLLIKQFCSPVQNAAVTVQGRIMRPDGQVVVFRTVGTTNPGAITNTYLDLCEGYLLDVVAWVPGGNLGHGAQFIQVCIARGFGATPDISAVLISGNLGGSRALGWPFSELMDSTDGQGYVDSVSAGNPAAGAEWVYTVPATVKQRIRSVFFTLTTAVAVATRIVTLVVDDGANIFGQFPATISQLASLTNTYTGSAAPNNSLVLVTQGMIALPPDLILPQLSRIRTVTTALQGADQYSTIRIERETWTDTQ